MTRDGRNVAVRRHPSGRPRSGDSIAAPRGIRLEPSRSGSIVLAVALAVALVIRTLPVAPFYIPSTSMVDTLQVDDRILVNKLSYRLHDVNRGDVVRVRETAGRGVRRRRSRT